MNTGTGLTGRHGSVKIIPVCEQAMLQINNYPLLIDAARNGQGIALGWRYLVDADLKN